MIFLGFKKIERVSFIETPSGKIFIIYSSPASLGSHNDTDGI